ncbi:MAG: right-handed parallel beta-helix repeat-containing protein [Lachnospiraceae bacterium]|nr:right-handed parallel beta-helix repeat-containing protein [Lachnospiraceae bacterium]
MDYRGKKVFLRKKNIVLIIALLLCCIICGCSEEQTSEQQLWIPDSNTKETSNSISKKESQEQQEVSVYLAEELTSSLLQDSGRSFADMLWENQKAGGVYQCDSEQMKSDKLLNYYISSSEGDDENDGLSPKTPKKSLETFSGLSNVNIFLKCGDIFHMKESFCVGNNVTMAAYGEGMRPVLNYYQPLKVQWQESDIYKNVWSADLKELSTLCDGTTGKSNCNIGQLLIDGECNWKRKIKDDGEAFNYGEYLFNAADGSWAIDWENSVLHLFSDKNPNDLEISYALPDYGLVMNSTWGSQVLGVEITGAGFHGISLSNVNNIKIQNCYLHHIGGALLKNTGPRYGNGIELWDSGQEVTVSYNIAEWIFDTCYTNQGSSASAVEKNVQFTYNIGRYCFWGIETWGDNYAEQAFENIGYKGNILMNACDVTNPEAVAFCNQQEQLIGVEGNLMETQVPYVSYRGGTYTYHQMSLINARDNRKEGQLLIENNVFWGTKRFLCMFSKRDVGREFPLPENNLFYGEMPAEEICLFRYSDSDGTRHFLQQLPLGAEKNTLIVSKIGENQGLSEAKNRLVEAIEIIANGAKQE